jgi:hypothetical protein
VAAVWLSGKAPERLRWWAEVVAPELHPYRDCIAPNSFFCLGVEKFCPHTALSPHPLLQKRQSLLSLSADLLA